MIPDKITKAFNEQIMHEYFSAYLYLSMAAWLETEGLEGMGRWMRVQALEEMTHAMKFFDHILERGGEPELLAIEKPQAKWDSALDSVRERARPRAVHQRQDQRPDDPLDRRERPWLQDDAAVFRR